MFKGGYGGVGGSVWLAKKLEAEGIYCGGVKKKESEGDNARRVPRRQTMILPARILTETKSAISFFFFFLIFYSYFFSLLPPWDFYHL